MYKDPLSRKLIDVLGNQNLISQQKTWCLLDILHKEEDPNRIPEGIKVVLECCGLAPRHEGPVDDRVPFFDEELIQNYEKKNGPRVDHQVKGWFEINKDRGLEKTLLDICLFLETYTDDREKAIVFQMILSSKYIPIATYYFSRHTSEPSDDLILRQYAAEYIQMRQLLNLNVDPTSRGSLILDFLVPLKDKPHAQAVVLGSFIEELLRRLKNKHKAPPTPFSFQGPSGSAATFPFSSDMSPDQLKDMFNNFRSMLPPEILDQLKKLFGDKPEQDL
jgi:hypothetical protein